MSDRDYRLVRFVTARQTELRGLHTAIFGLWTVALFTLVRIPRHGSAKVVWLLAVFVLPNVAQQMVGEWYARYVGRVGASYGPLRPRAPWLLMLGGFALDSFRLTPVAGLSAIMLLIVAYSLWVVVRDAPFRIYHLAAILLPLVASRAGTSDLDALIPQYVLAGAWFAATGIADHCLMLIQLKRLRGVQPLPAPTDAPR